MITKAFEIAFQGCKRSLAEIVSSNKFERVRDKVANQSQLPANSDLGIAHRAGVLTMTSLLNQEPEGVALERAKALSVAQTEDCLVEIKTLVYLLGEALIEEAEKCLTDEMLQMAQEWQSATPKRQLEITHTLLKDLQSEGQGGIGSSEESAVERLRNSWERHLKSLYDDGLDAVLPALYGKWNPETNPANCQGKSQMVAAFARKAGARCLCVHPATTHRNLADRYAHGLVDLIVEDMLTRNLNGVDKSLDEGMYCSLEHRAIDNHKVFHVGCAIELSDGTWVMLDAHGRSWGVFPKHWNVPSVYRLLNKYEEVIPGLVIQGNDKGVAEQDLEKVMAKAKTFIDCSRSAEEDLREVKSLTALVEYIENSPYLDMVSDFIGLSKSGFLQNPMMKKIAVMGIVVGLGGVDIFQIPFKLMSLDGDAEFLERRKKSWLTVFHAAAQGHICDYLNRAEVIDPVIDFTTVEWSLAMAALNNCEFAANPFGRRSWEINELMIQLSADQTTLHNALRSFRRGELATAAQQCLASFPVRHALCKGL